MTDARQAHGFAPEIRKQLGFLRELNDLKRLSSPNLGPNSLATWVFRRASAAISAGEPLRADLCCAATVGAARLGAITPEILRDSGLDQPACLEIWQRSIVVHENLTEQMRDSLTAACAALNQCSLPAPPVEADWVNRLALAPRAGATCPGQPRLTLEPPENHGDHSLMVAVYGYLLADLFGADREDAWLIGLCHHFHNAYLPDAGFTGEMMLGNHLDQVLETLRARVITSLPDCYRARVIQLFREISEATTPLAMTFHAADTIDRVLQMEHYERVTQFRVRHALVDLNLVHEGPAQAFQFALLKSIGLFPEPRP